MHLVLYIYCILTLVADADIDALKHRLYDYNQLKLGEGQYISDWESGIVDDQITNISGSAQAMANVKAYTIETDDTDGFVQYIFFPDASIYKKESKQVAGTFCEWSYF